MNIRSLLPWLLVGVLVASVYANIAMYRNQPASARGPLLGRIPAHHLAPGTAGERCPTLDKLGLSREQRDQVRKCSLTSLDLRTDLAIEIDTASGDLHELLVMDVIDAAGVLQLADRISALRARQYRAWISSILVVHDVLSPDQLRLLRQLESN